MLLCAISDHVYGISMNAVFTIGAFLVTGQGLRFALWPLRGLFILEFVAAAVWGLLLLQIVLAANSN
jgi:hypothetical protein